MGEFAKQILPINIEDEMRQSYLDYAMSVIVGRALPDVRDGLKPVHRRALYAMHELGNDWNKAYKKSARIVGDTIGRFHPHGDTAVYDTLVRMAQPFSLRYMLVDGQGNFGCFTGDTKITLADGTEKSFAELAELPDDEVFYVYSVNKDGKIVIGEGRYSRVTRKNAELLELTLDNGETVRCTPDHRFMLRDGSYKEAQDLTPDDSLMPGYGVENLKPLEVMGKTDAGDFPFPELVEGNGKSPASEVSLSLTSTSSVSDKLAANEFTKNSAVVGYNHRITHIRPLTERVDTYDITVDEHHNFLLSAGVFVHNSVDGDAPAAMRYTEIRMAKIAHELLADLDKETVDFIPNYDETEHEPAVFPTRLPNLLINGSSGIAVGMATNIPPHNLREVVNACIALVENPATNIDDLMQHIPGPDFPTAAIINGAKGIHEAYQTGRGRIYLRARSHVEGEEGSKQKLVITELPYQVNKAKLVEKIAELVKEKKLDGITELRDESDKDGMRMVIELRRGEVPDVVLNNLYQHTAMQTVFGINMVTLIDGQPRLLNLKQILEAFIRHRREVVTRRSLYELRKARARAHILEGLAVALASIDPIIALIKAAPNPAVAKAGLLEGAWDGASIKELLQDLDASTSLSASASQSRPSDLPAEFGMIGDHYRLSETQAQAILDLRLHRLTGLEKDKIFDEYKALLETIAELLRILNDPDRLMQVIREELLEVRDKYQDERRTEITANRQDLSLEDLINEEDMVVTLSHEGYAKSQSLDTYQAQKRGGKGKSATQIKDEDFIDKLLIANTHDTILCFSSRGRIYWLKVYELPQAGRSARGKPLVNLLPLEANERINAILPVRDYAEDKFVFMATAKGTVKKTPLTEFSRPRSGGIIALDLVEGDQLINVALTDGQQDVLLFASDGKAMRFNEVDVRSMGRTARGVRGINLTDNARLIALLIVHQDNSILTATENGFGNRTRVEDYPAKHRGGKGVLAVRTSERNGQVVGAVLVDDDNDVMLISNRGTLVRTPVAGVSIVGRNTQGVKLINLGNDEQLVGIERIAELGEAELVEDSADNEADNEANSESL